MSGGLGPRADLLDEPRLWELMAGQREILVEVTQQFLEDCPLHRKDLQAALAQANAQGLHHAAHKLKGALMNMASDRCAALAQSLETLGFRGTTEGAGPVLAELESNLELLSSTLRSLLARLSRLPDSALVG